MAKPNNVHVEQLIVLFCSVVGAHANTYIYIVSMHLTYARAEVTRHTGSCGLPKYKVTPLNDTVRMWTSHLLPTWIFSDALERSQIGGDIPGAVAPNPVRLRLFFSRVELSPPLASSIASDFCLLTHGALCAEGWKNNALGEILNPGPSA